MALKLCSFLLAWTLIGSASSLAGEALPTGEAAARDSTIREETIGKFEELLNRYPESDMEAPVLLLLGNLYMEREKARYLGEVARYERDHGEAAARERDESPRLDYGQAMKIFQRIVEGHSGFPGRVEALHALGVCHDEMGHVKRAEEYLQQAARLAPDSTLRTASLLRLGDLRFAHERWEDALQAYQEARALGVDPSYEKLDYRIGWCHLKQGELADAGAHFQEAADRVYASGRVDPRGEALSEILRSLALVQVQTNPADIRGYGERFREEDYRRKALVEFGHVLADHDHPVFAEEVFRQALRLDDRADDAAEVHDLIIECLSAQDRKKDAGLEMEVFIERYGMGSAWLTAEGRDADRITDVEDRLRRNAWNAALLRFRSGGMDDLRVAARLFEKYVDELGATEQKSRAHLFAAEAWFTLGEYERSADRYDRIVPDDLEEADRKTALQGAVLAHGQVEGHEGEQALAALRYARDYPGDPDAEKALLVAAEREEAVGHLSSALRLCEEVAKGGNSALEGEAELRAGRLSALLGDRAGAETWFLRSAEAAVSEAKKGDRVERAAASALLLAKELEEEEKIAEAADAYHHVWEQYRATSLGPDALLHEMRCRVRSGPEETLLSIADSAVVLSQGKTEAADLFRGCASEAAQGGRYLLAGRLLRGAYQILSDPKDLLAAGLAYGEGRDRAAAAAAFEEVIAADPDGPEGAEASYRFGIDLADVGEHERAAQAFDRALAAGRDGPAAREIELLCRAGGSYIAAGEEAKGKERLERAVARFEEGKDHSSTEELHAAKAHRDLARLIVPRYEAEAARWRGGRSGKTAAAILEEEIAHYRSAIALRYEGVTEESARELAALLELHGRTALLREWEQGNIPDCSIVEPYYSDALALLHSTRAKGTRRLTWYADLADTLTTLAGFGLEEAPSPSGEESFERQSDAVAARLTALDRAEEMWRASLALLKRQGEVDGTWVDADGRRMEIALEAARASENGALLLRGSPSPPDLSDEERDLYRSLIEERAVELDRRAQSWFLELPGAEPEIVPPVVTRRAEEEVR